MAHAIYTTVSTMSLFRQVRQPLCVAGALVFLNEVIIIIVGVMRTKITRGKIG